MSSLPAALFEPAAGFAPDERFVLQSADAELPAPQDAAAKAFAEGHAKGFEEALAQAKAEHEAENAARERIELAFVELFEADRARIEERLRQCVLQLCEAALAPLALEPEQLTKRIGAALDLLRRAEDERVLRLHPEDIALLKGRLPDQVKVEADASLKRGELRVETAEGGVEDGPRQWRRVLAETLGLEASDR